MKEYSFAANQFKEEIIKRYLKENPGVSREDIHCEILNGRVIIKKKPRILRTQPSPEKERKRSIQDCKVLQKLEEQDRHYRSAQNSIRSVRSLVESLHSCPYIEFNSEQRQSHMDTILDLEEQLKDHSLTMFSVKEKYQDYLDNTRKPLPSLLHTMKLELMGALLAQLMVLAEIFNYEIHLGGLFGGMVQDFFRRNIDRLRDADEKILEYIGKSIKFLRIDLPRAVHCDTNSDVKALEGVLDRLNGTLSHRRKQVQQIQRLILVVSNYLDSQTERLDDLSVAGSGTGKRKRMVFSARTKRKKG